MNQSKFHKIQVRKRTNSEGISTGANTEILLDGKPLKGATFFKFEVGAKKTAKVLIELFAEVELDIETQLTETNKENNDYTIQGKPVKFYTLSNYEPRIVATKE